MTETPQDAPTPQDMADEAMISVEASPVVKVPVDLIGVRYTLTPPKAALALRVGQTARQKNPDPDAVLKGLNDWLIAAFGKKVAASIQKRMDDPEDQLDFPHITSLINKVLERFSMVPTT